MASPVGESFCMLSCQEDRNPNQQPHSDHFKLNKKNIFEARLQNGINSLWWQIQQTSYLLSLWSGLKACEEGAGCRAALKVASIECVSSVRQCKVSTHPIHWSTVLWLQVGAACILLTTSSLLGHWVFLPLQMHLVSTNWLYHLIIKPRTGMFLVGNLKQSLYSCNWFKFYDSRVHKTAFPLMSVLQLNCSEVFGFEICWHVAMHVKTAWASLPFLIYLIIVCHIHGYCRYLKLYISFWLTVYFETDMCNLQLLLNRDCIKCRPLTVVTLVSEKWHNCGSLKFFVKVVIHINVILVSMSVDMAHVLWQSIACSAVVSRCYLLSVWSFQCGGIWLSLDGYVDTNISEELDAFIFGVCPRTNYLTPQTEATST
jgi:hypothetical protein